MEHRWGERVRADFPVRVTATPFSIRDGRLTDLSVSGASIQASLEKRLFCRVEIALVLPTRPRHESPLIGGYVTRVHKSGFGVEWCEFAPLAVKELLRTLTARRYARPRRADAPTFFTTPRLAAPLLKHEP
jgi:hypothetical protein